MPDLPRPLSPGDWVRRKNDTSMVGQVLELSWNDQLESWKARVEFGSRITTVSADTLERFVPGTRSHWDELAGLRLGSARQLVALLTLERLRHPPSAIGHALGSARARFYPFQFKPLLKFLDHPTHRVLIADDVGLGKTIEAGYILREWRARREVHHVLVLCPARLRNKWKNELNTKFGETFEIVGADQLRSMLRRAAAGEAPDPFAWIGSYESLRADELVTRLEELELPLDLVILDEAHRVRNSGSQQHRLARALTSSAEGAVFLTATPVQMGFDDLYHLLNLLEPGAFGRQDDFASLLTAYRPVVDAQGLVAEGRAREAGARLRALSRDARTVALAETEAMRTLVRRLDEAGELDRERRVQLQAELADFTLTGAVLSRTRKRDVVIERAIREPQTPRIEPTLQERAIYDAVRDAIRQLYPAYSGWGRQMAALQLYRMTASSVPAAAQLIGRRLHGDEWQQVAEQALADHEDEAEALGQGDPLASLNLAQRERLLLALAHIPTRETDSKYLMLRKVLDLTWGEDKREPRPRRKVVIFANFRGTLEYLSRALDLDGVKHRLIHGGVSIDDRDARINDFLEDKDREINVLLSSEVGGEGLDLQKACVLVNYDLPWNPMVVEQRIGRLDRIGQESKTIVVINLVLKGTIEDRIVARLYNRIGLFRQSIGDLEEILGERVEELVTRALAGQWSEAQQETEADRVAQVLEGQQREIEQVRQRTDELISADQGLLDEIDQLRRRRRVPDPAELRTLLVQFLEARYNGIRLDGDPVVGTATLTVPVELHRDLNEWGRTTSAEVLRWAGRLGAGALRLTLNPEVALRHAASRVDLITPRHPLTQYAVQRLGQESAVQGAAFGVRLRRPDLAVGRWVVGVWALDLRGSREERRLVMSAIDVDGARTLGGDDAEKLVLGALESGEELDPRPALSAESLARAVARLREQLDPQVTALTLEGRSSEERRLARRKATWSTTLKRNIDQQRELMARLRAQGQSETVLRMHQGKLKRREGELQVRMEELAKTPRFDIEEHEVCSLLLINEAEVVQS